MHLEWKNTTPYRRGDVVLVKFPHSNLTTYSKRPALIVQDENVHTEHDQWIILQITTQPWTGATRVPVSSRSRDGMAMGIISDSVIVADNIATVETKTFDKVLGRYPSMQNIDTALRKIFRL